MTDEHIRQSLDEDREKGDRQHAEYLLAQNIESIGYIFSMLQSMVYALEQTKGWYDQDISVPAICNNLHSEVAELFKEWRDHDLEKYYTHQPDPFCQICIDMQKAGLAVSSAQPHPQFVCPKHPPKPEGVSIELADILIRVFGDAARWDIDLAQAFREKLMYNWTRPYRHGRGDKP